jgi:hypothetical protein
MIPEFCNSAQPVAESSARPHEYFFVSLGEEEHKYHNILLLKQHKSPPACGGKKDAQAISPWCSVFDLSILHAFM